MPHDKNGKLIRVGDEVIVRFTVKAVMENEDYCNVNLESVEKMPPKNEYGTSLCSINTRQTEKV